MEEQSSRLMKELEQEKIKLEMDVDSLQKSQVSFFNHDVLMCVCDADIMYVYTSTIVFH